MADATGPGDLAPGAAPTPWWEFVLAKARNAGPLLLFGVRLWASVSLAAYVAFWLELDNAYCAATRPDRDPRRALLAGTGRRVPPPGRPATRGARRALLVVCRHPAGPRPAARGGRGAHSAEATSMRSWRHSRAMSRARSARSRISSVVNPWAG